MGQHTEEAEAEEIPVQDQLRLYSKTLSQQNKGYKWDMGPIQTPGMFPRRNQTFSAATNLVSEFGKVLRDALVLQGDHVTMPLPTCITDYNKKDQETRAGDSRSLQQTLPSVCESVARKGLTVKPCHPFT